MTDACESLLTNSRKKSAGMLSPSVVFVAKLLFHQGFFFGDARNHQHCVSGEPRESDQPVRRHKKERNENDLDGGVHRIAHPAIGAGGHKAMAFGAKMQARSEIAAEGAVHPCKHRDSEGARRNAEPSN